MNMNISIDNRVVDYFVDAKTNFTAAKALLNYFLDPDGDETPDPLIIPIANVQLVEGLALIDEISAAYSETKKHALEGVMKMSDATGTGDNIVPLKEIRRAKSAEKGTADPGYANLGCQIDGILNLALFESAAADVLLAELTNGSVYEPNDDVNLGGTAREHVREAIKHIREALAVMGY